MKPKFCTQCAAPLESRRLEDERRIQHVCPRCGHIEWQNPKPTVSALMTRQRLDGGVEVLLTRRAASPCQGCWDVPGGFIDVDEHPEDALRRELHEELGIEADVRGFVGIYMDRYGDGDSTLNVFYEASIRSGTILPRSDVSEAAWYPLEQLPEPLAFDNGRQALEALRSIIDERSNTR